MRTIGIPELVVIAAVILFLLPAIFYLISLQKALERCAPQCRTMPPGQVWLLLIPLFGLVWHFIIVERMASSLRNEFVRRRMPLADPEPGKALGIAMCVLFAACLVPILGAFAALAAFVCWILYWVKIADYSRQIELPF